MEIMLFLFFAGALASGIALAVRERRRSFERAIEDASIEPMRPASLGGPLPPRPPAPPPRMPRLSSATLASKVREACGHKLNEAKEAVEAMGRAGVEALPDPWSLEREAPEPTAGLEEWKAFEGRVDTLVASIDARRPPRRSDVVSGRAPATSLYRTPRPAAGTPAQPRAPSALSGSRASRPSYSAGSSGDDDISSFSAFSASDGGGADDGGGCSDGGGSDAGSCSSSD